jgi:hypothetical protein
MNDLAEAFKNMTDGFENFREIVRRKNPSLYERWEAGGFLVSDNIVSMYPCASEVMDEFEDEDENEYEDEDEL